MQRWMQRVALVAFALTAPDADAWQSHYLHAVAGSPFNGDSSDDPLDVSVEALFQVGVCGVDVGCFFAHAEANSDSGVVLAESQVVRGPESPASGFSAASIEQVMEIEDAGDPVTIVFTFNTSLSVDRDGTGRSEAAARLDVGPFCNVYVEARAGEDTEVIDECSGELAGGNLVLQAFASADGISVRIEYAAGSAPNSLDFLAQVENDIDMGFIGGMSAQAFASGALAISVDGATSYHFTSPTFLTAPEPGATALAIAALAPLAIARRRRREA